MLAAWYQSVWFQVATRPLIVGPRAIQLALLLLLLGMSNTSFAWKMEAGVITIQDTFGNAGFTPVVFQQIYDVTPLVFLLPSEQGGDPSDIRVRAVTPLGFEAVQAEPPGNDGPHVAMQVHYIAIEPGSHTLPGGSLIQAGSVSTTEHQRGSGTFPGAGSEGWERVDFPVEFDDTPAVVAQIQSMVNESGVPAAPAGPSIPWLTTAIDNVRDDRFDAALERSQANDGNILLPETFGWLAMEDGAFDTFIDNANNSVNVTAVVSGRVIRGWDNPRVTVSYADLGAGAQPIVGASLNNHRDNDGGWVRYRQNSQDRDSVQLRGDEDRDGDSERSKSNGQANEAGVIAFSRSFDAEFSAGAPDLLFMKRIDEVISDEISPTGRQKAIPGATVQYVLNVTNHGDGEAESVTISDAIPVNSSMFVGDINGANSGPVRAVVGSSGLGYSYTPLTPTLDDLEFSDDDANTWDYQPTPGSTTPDPLITHFRINFSGNFAANPGGPAPNLDVYFRVVVD